MLHELAKYATKEGLSVQPGFKAKRGKWVVMLERGQYVGFFPRDRDYPKAPNLGQPELVGGGKEGTRCHFLLESASVATGFAIESEQVASKHANFLRLLRDAVVETPELQPCIDLLEDTDRLARLHDEMSAAKVKPSDAVTFLVDDKYLPELTSWHGWWQRYRLSLATVPAKNTPAEMMVDFLSGELVEPALTHGKVGLSQVGGTAFGSALISFDKEAFESYGFSQSQNAAISEDGVSTYVAALNALVQAAPAPLGGMLILHWYDKAIERDLDPIWAGFGEEEDDGGSAALDARLRMEKILNAVREGSRPEFSQNRYHILMVTGSAGRVMVRDWFTGEVRKLVESIQKWFDDLDVVGPTGRRVSNAPKLFALMMRMVDYRPGEKFGDTIKRVNTQLPPTLPAVWRSILTGGPLPDTVALAALRYAQSRFLRSDDENESGSLDRLACALVRAWFNRHFDHQKEGIRLATQPEGEPVVDVNEESPAYHIGRLLAYIDYMQQEALEADGERSVGNRVGKRYYSAAISRPVSVLASMTKNVEDYLSKIRRVKGENGDKVEFAMRSEYFSIVKNIHRQTPETLSPKEQAMFMFGFYEQQAEIVRRRIAGAAAKRSAKAEESGASNDEEDSVSTEEVSFDETGAN